MDFHDSYSQNPQQASKSNRHNKQSKTHTKLKPHPQQGDRSQNHKIAGRLADWTDKCYSNIYTALQTHKPLMSTSVQLPVFPTCFFFKYYTCPSLLFSSWLISLDMYVLLLLYFFFYFAHTHTHHTQLPTVSYFLRFIFFHFVFVWLYYECILAEDYSV